mmetsp:Transcript_30184/g.50118  ORF Transcript_30184/g.50118 Transcript_30184/m.50118 type:complete len:111 (+) Transcript_30184:229-561(+)
MIIVASQRPNDRLTCGVDHTEKRELFLFDMESSGILGTSFGANGWLPKDELGRNESLDQLVAKHISNESMGREQIVILDINQEKPTAILGLVYRSIKISTKDFEACGKIK